MMIPNGNDMTWCYLSVFFMRFREKNAAWNHLKTRSLWSHLTLKPLRPMPSLRAYSLKRPGDRSLPGPGTNREAARILILAGAWGYAIWRSRSEKDVFIYIYIYIYIYIGIWDMHTIAILGGKHDHSLKTLPDAAQRANVLEPWFSGMFQNGTHSRGVAYFMLLPAIQYPMVLVNWASNSEW